MIQFSNFKTTSAYTPTHVSKHLWVKSAQFRFISFFFPFFRTRFFDQIAFFSFFCRVLLTVKKKKEEKSSTRNGTDDDFLSAFDVSIAYQHWLMTDTDEGMDRKASRVWPTITQTSIDTLWGKKESLPQLLPEQHWLIDCKKFNFFAHPIW